MSWFKITVLIHPRRADYVLVSRKMERNAPTAVRDVRLPEAMSVISRQVGRRLEVVESELLRDSEDWSLRLVGF